MELNPNIILSGVQPNFLAGIQQANQAAAQQNGFQREQAMNQLYQTQGAGIANGDPAALNALAGFSPQAAVDIRGAQQNMAFDAEKMDYFRQDAKAKAAANVASLSAAEAAAKAAKIDQAIAAGTAAQNPDQWDQTMRSFGAPEYVGQFENRGPIIASAMGVKDALEAAATAQKDARDAAAGPEWRPATPEEAKAQGAVAGQINTKTGKFDPQNPPSRMAITTNPDGTMSFSQGPDMGGVGTSVKAGTAPQGFTPVNDPNAPGGVALVATPGGPEAAAAGKAKTASDLAFSSFKNKADIVDKKITNALASIDLNGQWVAGYGSYLQNLPNTEAIKFKGYLDTIKANLGYEELQNMRDNSPTGGALGAISERETTFLQSMQASLDQAQKPEDLRKILTELQVGRRKFQAEREAIMRGGQSGGQAPEAPPSGLTPEQQSVFDKYKN